MKKIGYRKIIVILFIIAIICDGIHIYNVYTADKEEYTNYHKQYTNMLKELESDIRNIKRLESNEVYYEDNLYKGMKKYYKNTDDEVMRYVFKQRFPSTKEYEADRTNAFVVIYALLELYPQLEEDDTIKDNVTKINDTLKELKELIDTHNDTVDECNKLISKINDSNYINRWRWNEKLIIDTEAKKVIFVEE